MYVDVKDQIIKDLARRLAFMTIRHKYPADRRAIDRVIIQNLMEELLIHTGKKIYAYMPKLDEVDISELNLPVISSDLNTAISTDMDVLIIPMLGHHFRGYRLGRGGGFYDKLLAAKPGLITIGLAYQDAESPFVPSAFDKPLQKIITEEFVYAYEAGRRFAYPHRISE